MSIFDDFGSMISDGYDAISGSGVASTGASLLAGVGKGLASFKPSGSGTSGIPYELRSRNYSQTAPMDRTNGETANTQPAKAVDAQSISEYWQHMMQQFASYGKQGS